MFYLYYNIFFNVDVCHRQKIDKYTLCLKKQDTKLLPITSQNVNRFSKFFYWQTHWKICNKLIFKYSTTL